MTAISSTQLFAGDVVGIDALGRLLDQLDHAAYSARPMRISARMPQPSRPRSTVAR